jgi:hypothetical protein
MTDPRLSSEDASTSWLDLASGPPGARGFGSCGVAAK